MPIFDFECDKCGFIEERILFTDECNRDWQCSCGGVLKRIFTASGQYRPNEDTPWIRTVADVIERDSTNKHDQRFLQSNQTRADLKRWQKGRGLRHLEPGEGPSKPEPFNEKRHTDKVMEKRIERNRLEI